MECQNCGKTNSVEYTNGVILCSGLVKETEDVKKDVIKYCVIKEDLEETHEMHVVETLDMISLLTESISLFFNPVDLDELTTHIKSKTAIISSNGG